MSGMWGRNSDERVWGSLDNGRYPFPVALSGTPSGCSFQPWSCGGLHPAGRGLGRIGGRLTSPTGLR